MATRTVPFCLEMLTFGHPESSWGTRVSPRRGEGLWPLAQCLFAWKCLHSATQRALGTLCKHHLATQRAPAHFARTV